MNGWDSILPASGDDNMWGVVISGDDIAKIVAAVGVILTILLQAWNNRQSKAQHAETKLQLQHHGNQLAMLAKDEKTAAAALPQQCVGGASCLQVPKSGPNPLGQNFGSGPHF